MKQVAVIVFLTVLAYSNIFNNKLVVDDHIFVGKYQPSIFEAFAGAVPPGHEGVYRPIRGLFYTLYGSNPVLYHLNSLLVQVLSTVLVYLIISNLQFPIYKQFSKIQFSNYFAFVAALFFGLHPVHTETITYIASAMDSIGIVFFLTSFYFYLRSYSTRSEYRRPSSRLEEGKREKYLSILFALFAFFTTEMTLTLPLLLVLYEGILGRSGGWARYKKILPYFVGVGIYLLIRFGTLSITSRGPYLAGSFYLTMLSMSKVLMHYIWSLIWPVKLVSNHIISTGIEAFVYRGYRIGAIASQSILDPEILFSIGLIGLICLIGLKLVKKHPLVSFGIGWFFIGLLPVLELVPQGSIMNEKSLYISSIGFVLVMSFFFVKLVKLVKFDKWVMIGVMGIALFYGVRTYLRNQDWRDDIALWSSDVRLEPAENAYARFALGNAYNDQKQYSQAVEQYQKSVEINPGFAVGFASLSRTYRDMGEIELSNLNYQKADVAEPGFWNRP